LSTLIHHHDYPIPPEQLDAYLSSGWRPAGQAVYTADFLRTDDDEIFGCIQVRLPLADFTFKKRHGKIIRRNAARFRFTCKKAYLPDGELLDLNRRYMLENPDRSREDLLLHVTGEHGWQALDTRIIRVYDKDKLVAFSYFDLGRETAYTKAGIYDPEYARFSLGIYTMLLEIDWLRRQGVKYYHPGYVVPRYPLFDYKLQFGNMEFRRVLTGEWLPYDHAKAEDNYIIMYNALVLLRGHLAESGLITSLFEYPSFTARFHFRTGGMNLFDSALFLTVGHGDLHGQFFIVNYRLETGEYQLLRVRDSHLRDMRGLETSSAGRPRYTIPIVVEKEITTTTSIKEAAAAIAALVRR
jgi:arginine-tRNA-protein transferase